MHATENHYHIYNRGAHKAPIFLDASDYHRFLHLLYVANCNKPVRLSQLNRARIYQYERRDTLVNIISYCLMPNHFHILVGEKTEKNIGRFMLKLCTAYSMYYNKKYSHSGTLFQGQYKSKYVGTDEYFRYLIDYIHLNPFSIDEPNMIKTAKPEYFDRAVAFSQKYEYSSYKDYLGENRLQRVILARVGLA